MPVTINIRWTEEEKDDLDFINQIMKENSCPRSSAVRYIVKQYRKIRLDEQRKNNIKLPFYK